MEEQKPVELVQGFAKVDEAPAFEPRWYKLDEIVPVALREGVSARFVTGGRIMFSFVRLESGGRVELHQHPHEQCGYMLEGSMDLTIGDETRELRPGDAYTIPGGVPHAATGGLEGGLALDVFSPVREDYAALAEKAAQGR
ncbi:MAG: Pectin degradation protein KdgF [uncultured Thermomicrobiales bacterium]|uniref:Pectin degradation protein KdgF n=1 Tax=uncultured Thermomicrobiales bacterium TaxID=1645740 RepID=A0A6J4VBH0_9BACT|nr:MAG: Pectin degradation protein KdgF [uncultured Thermomicrobiales bacterium]